MLESVAQLAPVWLDRRASVGGKPTRWLRSLRRGRPLGRSDQHSVNLPKVGQMLEELDPFFGGFTLKVFPEGVALEHDVLQIRQARLVMFGESEWWRGESIRKRVARRDARGLRRARFGERRDGEMAALVLRTIFSSSAQSPIWLFEMYSVVRFSIAPCVGRTRAAVGWLDSWAVG